RGALCGGARGPAAQVRDGPSRGCGTRGARHRGVRVHAVSHRDRAVRAARGLPVVRRLCPDHDGDLGVVHRATPSAAVAGVMTAHADARAGRGGRYLVTLALTALGVVYGDIGTSPLYAIRESFYGTHGIAVTHGNVLGVLSLVFWALVIVVTIKYHTAFTLVVGADDDDVILDRYDDHER